MSTAPTLDRKRTDQMRTFLVAEAAASVATPARASAPRASRPVVLRAVVGGSVAAALVAGGVAITLTSGPEPSTERVATPTTAAPPAVPLDLQTIAVESADGWSTIRVVDADADPAAVLTDLQAAGFEAEQAAAQVGPDGSLAFEPTVDAVFGLFDLETVGAGGLLGLTVTVPDGQTLAVEGDGPARTYSFDGQPTVRFDGDGSLSIRQGAGVSVVVTTA